ncbi:hypothetical protein [Nocardia farcinica]|uniref:hypothetical protein n=1 Tax=Nocardia farcinica TaxID=37329 RepID=UPI0002ED2CF7|nr:hypothetical protein [Nocardia farcinica]
MAFGGDEHAAAIDHTYAAASSSELLVVRGAEIVARASISPLPWGGKTVMTNDRRHYARLSAVPGTAEQDEDGQVELITVSVADGRVVRRECPGCTSAAAIGPTEVVVTSTLGGGLFDTVGALLVFDAATEDAPSRLTPRPPGVNRVQQATEFVAAMGLVAGSDEAAFAIGYDQAATMAGMYRLDRFGGVRFEGLRRYYGFRDEDGRRWGLVDTTAAPVVLAESPVMGMAFASTYEADEPAREDEPPTDNVGCTRHTLIDIVDGTGDVRTLRIDDAVRAAGMDPSSVGTVISRLWQSPDGILRGVVRVRGCDPKADAPSYWDLVVDGRGVRLLGQRQPVSRFGSGAAAVTVSEGFVQGERPFAVRTGDEAEWGEFLEITGTAMGLRETSPLNRALPLPETVGDRTRLSTVRPVDNTRKLRAEYDVQRRIDGACRDSRHRVARVLLECTTAEGTHELCWAGQPSNTAYCLDDVTGRSVVEVRSRSGRGVGVVGASDVVGDGVVRIPLALRLIDGRTCALDSHVPPDAHDHTYTCIDGSQVLDNQNSGPTAFVADGTLFTASHRALDGTLTDIPITELFLVQSN